MHDDQVVGIADNDRHGFAFGVEGDLQQDFVIGVMSSDTRFHRCDKQGALRGITDDLPALVPSTAWADGGVVTASSSRQQLDQFRLLLWRDRLAPK